MSELDGYQVVVLIECQCDCEGAEEHAMDNLSLDEANALLRQWHRHWLLRKGSGLVLTRDGEDMFVPWRKVLDMRIQPQVEAIA